MTFVVVIGEIRGYDDMGPAFAASGFTEQHPPDLLDIRHIRRGYFAATSFTDAQVGRVMGALDAAGPNMSEQTITVLWSDHGCESSTCRCACSPNAFPECTQSLQLLSLCAYSN